MKHFFFFALLLCTLAGQAQTKSETKLYNAAVSKNDLKSFDKFLAKFPNSPYAEQIRARKDSILFYSIKQNDEQGYTNFIKSYPRSRYTKEATQIIEQMNTSTLQPQQATTIFKKVLQLPDNLFASASLKSSGIEYIAGVIAPSVADKQNYKIVLLQHNGIGGLEDVAAWSISAEKTEPRYIQNDKLQDFKFPKQEPLLKTVMIGGDKYLSFEYLNESKNAGSSTELIFNLYSLADKTVYSAMFSGKLEKEGNENVIEGTCMDASQGGALATEQMDYLLKTIKSAGYLRPVSKEKALTDEAIEWWYGKNPANTQTLAFGILPDDNPIAVAFSSAKDKEKGRDWDVAFFDTRETTVVVAYNKAKKQYSLVWCESAPKNTKTDKFLNTIYFENDSSIVLYYYKGNTTSKKRINLVSKSIR